MNEFFDIEKLEKYKGWLKKITQYFNYKKVDGNKLWDFLTNQLSFNEDQWYDLKLSLIFLYVNFFDSDGQYDNLDINEIQNKLNYVDDDEYNDYQFALAEFLELPPFLMADQEYGHYNYGTTIIDLSTNTEYAVYKDDEVDEAYHEWKIDYLDQSYLEDLYDIESFIEIEMDSYPMRELIDSMVDDDLVNMDDDEILERSGYDSKKQDLEENISSNKSRIEEIESKLDDLMYDLDSNESELEDYINDNDEGDYDDEIEDLEYTIEQNRSEISELESEMEELESLVEDEEDSLERILEDAKEELRDSIYEDIEYDIDSDPLGYLAGNLGYSFDDIVNSGFGYFDRDSYMDQMFDDYERANNLGQGYEEEISYKGNNYWIYEL